MSSWWDELPEPTVGSVVVWEVWADRDKPFTEHTAYCTLRTYPPASETVRVTGGPYLQHATGGGDT